MAAETTGKKQWTSKALLEWTTDYLASAEVDQPRLCAEILLAYVLKSQRIDLYVKFDYCPEPEQLAQFRQLVKRCGQHEPVAYLTGKGHFYSLALQVSPDVLIPRAETEVLVTQAIGFIRNQTSRPAVDVLDLCTGSGCVAIAIAVNAVEAEVLAIDRSSKALEIAQKNIEAHDLQSRIAVLESDLFTNINQADKGIFDLIVCNPPYICADDFERLDAAVRDYEPKEALLAGEDGLDYYRRITVEAEQYLADNAALMVEVAYNQAEQVIALFEKSGYLNNITAIKDDLGHLRVVKAKKK